MPERLRCTQCKKLIDEPDLVDHKLKPMAEQLKHKPQFSQFFKPWHQVYGRYGRYDFCGPVEVEEVDEYILQFEHMIGETT